MLKFILNKYEKRLVIQILDHDIETGKGFISLSNKIAIVNSSSWNSGFKYYDDFNTGSVIGCSKKILYLNIHYKTNVYVAEFNSNTMRDEYYDNFLKVCAENKDKWINI